MKKLGLEGKNLRVNFAPVAPLALAPHQPRRFAAQTLLGLCGARRRGDKRLQFLDRVSSKTPISA